MKHVSVISRRKTFGEYDDQRPKQACADSGTEFSNRPRIGAVGLWGSTDR